MARNEKNSACDFFSHSGNFDAISCKKMREYREIAPENDPCVLKAHGLMRNIVDTLSRLNAKGKNDQY